MLLVVGNKFLTIFELTFNLSINLVSKISAGHIYWTVGKREFDGDVMFIQVLF